MAAALSRFDAASREYAYHRNQELVRESGRALADARSHPVRSRRGAAGPALAPPRRAARRRAARARRADLHAARDGAAPRAGDDHRPGGGRPSRRHRPGSARRRSWPRSPRSRRPPAGGTPPLRTQSAVEPLFEPQPTLDAIQDELSRRFGRSAPALAGRIATSWPGSAASWTGAVQMPGWTNVWTMPIQNRVDMLATGVNTPIGIRVLGRNLDDVVRGSEEVARVVKGVPRRRRRRGRPDPGQALHRDPPRPRAGRAARRERRRGQRGDRDGPGRQGRHDDHRGPRAAPGRRPLRRVASRGRGLGAEPPGHRHGRRGRARARPRHRSPLRSRSREVAEVHVVEGPATIKGENGLLRNYVRLERPGPRRRRPRRRGAGGRRPRRPAAGRRLPRVDRPVRA